jgi:hypothetical protein
MEKFLKIGERYVQWIALSLGALYLGLMAYNYVLTPPITVTMDKKEYLPGEIDLQIRNGALKTIEKDMNSPKPWADPTPVNPAKELEVAFVGHAPQNVPLARANEPFSPNRPTSQPVNDQPSLAKAPAPEPSPIPPSMGLALANVPQPAAAAPANPAGGPAAAGAPVQPVLAPEEHDWDTFAWTVNAKALDNAFQAAHIPNVVYQTAFLRVKLQRQEVLPNGTFGPVTNVAEIPTVTLDPMPPETAPVADKAAYLTWAADHAADILTPPFFSVTYGTTWYPPGAQKPNDVFPVAGAPLPAAPVFPQQPLVPPRAPGIGLMPPHGVRTPGLPPPAVAPGLMPPHGIMGRQPPVPPAAMQPGGVGPGFVQGAGAAGFINPALVPDITIYTHDWTVQAGHSYRYCMSYTISNPLFGVQQADVKPADRDHLAITSPPSVWTAPIDIPSRYRFWVQKFQRNGKDEVIFDLFTKKPGAPGGLERSTIRATPGDSIGPSPWLLVDVRQDAARHSIFLIADPTGHIERHELEKDKTDPDHLEMLDRTGASAAAIGG